MAEMQECVQRDFWLQSALDRLRPAREQHTEEPEPSAPLREASPPPLPSKPIQVPTVKIDT